MGTALPILSIIIPALNESIHVSHLIATLEPTPRLEVILVDGGSTDGTAYLAESQGARVVVSPRGRASQMNAGAAVARGEILLFLHADTRLPRGFERIITGALERPGVAAGAFRLGFDGEASAMMRLVVSTANWRAKHLQMPFGDQGIFLTKDVFEKVGGYAEIPIMEDLEITQRLKRHGRIVILDAEIQTSFRRYHESGLLRRVMRNKVAFFSYFLGVSPNRIARWYED